MSPFFPKEKDSLPVHNQECLRNERNADLSLRLLADTDLLLFHVEETDEEDRVGLVRIEHARVDCADQTFRTCRAPEEVAL